MSATTAPPILEPGPAAQGERPHLVLVPTGPDAVGFTRTSTVGPVRLTLRGRLVTGVLALLLLLAAGLGASAAFASAPATQPHRITVVAGQTLSEIAAAQLPDLALGDAIVEIQLANSLSTDQIHAGQRLTIPVR